MCRSRERVWLAAPPGRACSLAQGARTRPPAPASRPDRESATFRAASMVSPCVSSPDRWPASVRGGLNRVLALLEPLLGGTRERARVVRHRQPAEALAQALL